MTTFDKSTLQNLWINGFVPQGSDYTNLIQSQVNIAETSSQSMAGALITTELITPRVSATTLTVTGDINVTAGRVAASAATLTGKLTGATAAFSGLVSADSGISTTTVSATSINVTGDVSAATGTVYASAVRSTNGIISAVGVVSAAGTAQATAASLTFVINRGKGITDGQTTGFTPLANRAGLVQYLFNEGASANLWPPTGGVINGLATNAAFALAASAMVTIVHLTTSAYGVK